MATTFEAVRDAQAVILEALVPTKESGTRFKRHREGEFMAWIADNIKACFRRFQILSNFDDAQEPTSDGSLEGCRHSMDLRIAYPSRLGKYGAENERDMEDVIRADMRQIDAAIGLNGGSGYVTGQHACIRQSQSVIDVPGARVLSIIYELQYDRSV